MQNFTMSELIELEMLVRYEIRECREVISLSEVTDRTFTGTSRRLNYFLKLKEKIEKYEEELHNA